MVRFGLKLWSTNLELFAEARAAIEGGRAHFLELLTVPGKTDPSALAQQLAGIPVTLHAPQENQNFDLHKLTDAQRSAFRAEVSATADALGAPSIVVHGGVGNDPDRFAENFRSLHEPRILLENMPKDALGGGTCFGYSLNQLAFLHSLSGSLCIDFGHAIKAATSQGIEYHDFLSEILERFRPRYFHIADGDPKTGVDEHRSLGVGDYDLPWIAGRLSALGNREDVFVVFEVPKAGSGLTNDLANIERLRSLVPVVH